MNQKFAVIRENELKLRKNSELCGIFTCNSHSSSPGPQRPQNSTALQPKTAWQPVGRGQKELAAPPKAPFPEKCQCGDSSGTPPFPDLVICAFSVFSWSDWSQRISFDFFLLQLLASISLIFCWDLYYCLSSAYFGFILLLLFSSLAVFHKFWYAVFIFIQLKIFSNFDFDFFFDLWVILKGII